MIIVTWLIAMYVVYQRALRARLRRRGAALHALHVDPGGQLRDRRQLRRRRADGRAADRGHDHRHARPRLLDRLHGPRPGPLALLRLPQPVHVQHAAAGPGRQLPAALRGLGAGRPVELPADRLLVQPPHGGAGGQEGVPRQPRRRLRLRARHRCGLDDRRHAQLHGGLPAPAGALAERRHTSRG